MNESYNHAYTSFQTNNLKIYLGKYIKCVEFFLKNYCEDLLTSRVLWIDYYEIPLLTFYKHCNRTRSDIYFVECQSAEDFFRILKSDEISNIKLRNFSIIVLNPPPLIIKNKNILEMLEKIVSGMSVIILTSDLNFSIEEGNVIRVDAL